MKRGVLSFLAAAALMAMFPRAGSAQTYWAYGYSHIWVTQSVVYMWGYTAIDYQSAYTYSVQSVAIPEDASGHQIPGYPPVSASGNPSVGASDTMPAADGQVYGLQTNHWILAPSGDPLGYGTITPQNYDTVFTVYPTGTPGPSTCNGSGGPPDCYAVGSTYVHTDTHDYAPSVTGIDWTSYANPASPGGYPIAVLYGTDLTYWAGTPSQTSISVPGVYTNVAYADSGQINLEYAIPNGTAAGTITGTITTPNGSGNFTFNVSSGLGYQSISFPAIGNQSMSVSPINVSATATSGLTVVFSSDTTSVCTVSGTSVTLVTTGTCTVRAQQHGNGSYEAATDQTQSFTVTSGSGGGGGGSGSSYTDFIRLGSRLVAVKTGPLSGGPTLTASPSSGTYSSETFTFSYSNSAGVSGVGVLINSSVNGQHACWMYFDGSTLSLAEDDGSTWSGMLANSQCSLSSPTGIVNTGTDKAFTTTITFTSAFAGSRNIYMLGPSGYQTEGTITVAGSDVPSLSMYPGSGNTMTGTIAFTASDAETITGMTVLINTSVNGASACWFYTDGYSVDLADDGGNWGSSSLTNSQCTLSSPSYSTSGGLSLTVSITFTFGFAGAKNVYMWAENSGGGQAGYSQEGTWTVP